MRDLAIFGETCLVNSLCAERHHVAVKPLNNVADRAVNNVAARVGSLRMMHAFKIELHSGTPW